MQKALQYGRGMSVMTGFDLGAEAPLDSRYTVKTIQDRDAHVDNYRAYDGMLVYVESEKKTYQLIDGTWREFGTGVAGGGGSVSIQDFEALKKQVENNTTNLNQELLDREAADKELENKINDIDIAYKEADVIVLNESKTYTDTEIGKIKTDVMGINNNITNISNGLSDRIESNLQQITDIKNLISRSSRTVVVDTESEMAGAVPNPEVGDLAYVIKAKRAYIYKGTGYPVGPSSAPPGWITFDEITNELDLSGYLTEYNANLWFRRKDVPIEESDLHVDLVSKIDRKADITYVNDKVEEVVRPVREQAAKNATDIITNKNAIAKEVSDRQAEDVKIKNRIDKYITIIGRLEPQDTETGHVWLELI